MKKMRISARMILTFVIILVLVIGVFVVANILSSDMSINSDQEVIIEEGASTGDIASQLKSGGLIKNSEYFAVFSRIKGIDGTFKAGTYNFTEGSKIETSFPKESIIVLPSFT